MADSKSILEIKNLSVKRENRTVLDINSFSVNRGDIISVIGPNGAGKTTLLQAIMFLIKFNSGDIIYKGKKIVSPSEMHSYRRSLSMVFQESLLFNTSVYNNVASGLKFRHMKRSEIAERVEKELGRFGITHLAKRGSRELSGGEAQRVNLARAFAIDPDIILMDEPFSALDAPTRDSLMDDLEKILRSTGTSAIMATHDKNEALRLSDWIAVINSGSILQYASPEDLMEKPASEFVASFVGTETILKGRVVSHTKDLCRVNVNGSIFEISGCPASGTQITFCIQPENIIISSTRGGRSSARNVFKGKVSRIVKEGIYNKIYIDCGFYLISYITNESLFSLKLKPGSIIFATIKATSIHIIKTE